MQGLYEKTKIHIHHVRRHWLTVAFFLGFVVDNLTLNRVDQLFDNLVLFTYIVLAMGGLLLMYAAAAERLPGRIQNLASMYAPLLVQYAFGGLLSGMLIFYGKSGSWLKSWPYLLIILFIIFLNETIRHRSKRLVFNIAVLFVVLFSYVVLVVPVITGVMGPWIFVGSGVLALLVIYWFLSALYRVVPRFFALHARPVVFMVGAIYASLNFLYFSNVIPPIPLSLKDIGIYHNVVRQENGDYELTYEKQTWWRFLEDSDGAFHAVPGGNAFCFASVFAPTRLETQIFHRWEYWDEAAKTWTMHGERMSYSISGGRGGGYRGYTDIENFFPGTWRCSVETARGQVIGRETFTITDGAPGALVTTYK